MQLQQQGDLRMATAYKELDDVIECSICTEIFTDPRVLPCTHTFCLKCLTGCAKDKSPGDQLACPLCRKVCTIPEEGLGGLPINSFVEKLIHVKEFTDVEVRTPSCDLCSCSAESEETQINSATTYCHQCQENYCDPCASIHRQLKATRDHSLVQVAEKVNAEDLIARYPHPICAKHTDEMLKIYCNDCTLAVCVMCYIKDHNAHKCSDINEIGNAFCKNLGDDVAKIANGIEWCKNTLQALSGEKKNFKEHVGKTEQEVRERIKHLKQMIDKHGETVINKLESLDKKKEKDMDTTYEEVERQQAAMEGYVKYVNEIREKGTACDIAIAGSVLLDRAGELMSIFNITERSVDDVGHPFIAFTTSTLVFDDFTKTVGQLEMNSTALDGLQFSPTRLLHVQPGERGVLDVTSLCDKVFVVRQYKKEVEIRDIVTFELLRRVPLPLLSESALGIAACHVNKCLYVSDVCYARVLRLDLNTEAVTQWPVAKDPRGLSVTTDHNLLVTCRKGNKLQEYTTDGHLVREICLQSGEMLPRHAVQLSAADYVFSQDVSPGVVSVVGTDGRVVRSYGGETSPSTDVGPMKFPRSIAVTKHGDVLVADKDNKRILAIHSSFTRAQELPLPAGVGLAELVGLHLDESRDRLYIGEFSGRNRVIILHNIRSVSLKQ